MAKSKDRSAPPQSVFEDLDVPPEKARLMELKGQLAVRIIREARERGLSQKDLGELWGVPQPRVSEVLNAKLTLVSIDRLVEFLGMLGVEVSFRTSRGPRRKAG